ncbi:MAG: hypothetical protein J7L07_11095 [Candidatus Odinarchaeota archaeon]|nr:hypothetical protein [Candidatus Odinarchaeota archaeon]
MVAIESLPIETYASIALILGGIALASWFFEALSDKIPIFGKILTPIIKIIGIFGFFIGIADIVVAYYAFSSRALNTFTLVMLALLGIALFIAPLTKIPIAAFAALLSGAALAMLVLSAIPPNWWDTLVLISPVLTRTNIAIAAFIIGAVIVYSITRMITDIIEFIGKILTFKPIAFIIAFLAIAEGIAILLGTTIWIYIAPYLSAYT